MVLCIFFSFRTIIHIVKNKKIANAIALIVKKVLCKVSNGNGV